MGTATLEPTLTYQFILQTLVLVATGTWFLSGLKSKIHLIQNNIAHLERSHETLAEAFSQLSKVLTSVALQDQRLTMVEKRVDELAHGQGLIVK